MRGSSGQPSAERRLGRPLHALAAVTVLLAFLVFSSSAMASEPPTIESESVSGLTEHDATLEAQINSGGLETTYKFQIAQSPACLPPPMGYMPCGHVEVGALPGGSVPGASGASSVSLDLAGAGMTLQPSTTYYYRVVATNSAGPTVNGPSKTFSTPPTPKPTIESESVSGVSEHDATLEAQINTYGLYTAYEFQIDTNGSYNYTKPNCPLGVCDSITVGEPLPAGLVEPKPEYIPAGSGDQSVSLDLASIGTTLQPGTTYHYKVIASNYNGPTVEGPDQTFTTPTPPSIESESLSHLTQTDATLEAQIDTEGLETTYEFQLIHHLCPPGTEPLGCEAMIQKVPLPSGRLLGSFVSQTVSLDLNSVGVTLYPDAEYDYRVVVTSAAGKAEGRSQTFVTPEDGVQPFSTSATSPSSGGNQSGTSSTPSAVGGSSPTPGVTPLVSPLLQTVEPKALTKAQKLSRVLKQCKKKSKGKRAACVKQARKAYATVAKTSKKG